MRKEKAAFKTVLRIAQELGYAEKQDPTNDIGGFDAFYKLMILCNLAFGKQRDWDDETVEISGILAI